MKHSYPFLLVIAVLFCPNVFSQHGRSPKDLPGICEKVASVLGEDWFLVQNKTGFDVYFCRSCNARYEQYIDDWHTKPETRGEMIFPSKKRDDFFSPELADSVSYFTHINGAFFAEDDSLGWENYRKQLYKKDGILKFEVRFEKTWNAEKWKQANERNDLLKDKILEQPLVFSNNGEFSDYRFWLPDEEWKRRTALYDFYFERLPYTSAWYDYAVFIVPDKPFYFAEVLYADPSDERYYNNYRNYIDDEREKALKTIAFALGIGDFKLVN